MDLQSVWHGATLVVIVGATWRLSAQLAALKAAMRGLVDDHGNDCLNYDSARVRVARTAARVSARPPEASP
jgi:hypothetical protein